jgi:hypothetical protein
MAFTIPGLLGMNNQQPDPYQSLLGGYYTPQQAKMAWLGGSLQGLGAGLASGKSGAWAQGLALGGGEGLDNYRQRAMVAASLQNRKDEQAYQREQDEAAQDWREKTFAEDARRYGQDYALRKLEYESNAGWNKLSRGHQMREWDQQDKLLKGQTDAVTGWRENFESQGGNLFSPQMQAGLRASGVAGVDPNDTLKYNQTTPFVNAGDSIDAFKILSEQPSSSDLSSQVAQRKAVAVQMGLAPDSPAYQSYVLTGKMPREDQSPLTATDKKAILEADESVQANQQTIDLLTSVITPDQSGKTLNDRAGSGSTAGMQAWAARNDPTGFFNDATGEATTELQNIIMTQALGSLKSIFGGNPTEGERAILTDLQASVDKTPTEREPIIKRAIAAANRRLAFNKQRADSLRGQTYYKPGGASSSGPSADDLVKQYAP